MPEGVARDEERSEGGGGVEGQMLKIIAVIVVIPFFIALVLSRGHGGH